MEQFQSETDKLAVDGPAFHIPVSGLDSCDGHCAMIWPRYSYCPKQFIRMQIDERDEETGMIEWTSSMEGCSEDCEQARSGKSLNT